MNAEERLRQELQASLEMTTNYALETGDKTIYDTPEYHKIKKLLAVLLVGGKQKAATNYGGGGPDGGHTNGNK